MGIVYRGHDPVIDRPVALKTIVLPDSLSDPERETFLQRFFLEARIAGRLNHPNIVVTYDAATDEPTGAPFIAMELIDGDPLSLRIEREGPLAWKEAVDLVVPIAEALDHAHKNSIIHRDIKPANILVNRLGVPKIADFGIAKLPTANLTQTGVILGTPYFMSPEQLRAEPLDGKSDLFSLAGLLYNLITGHPPFGGTELASIASQVLFKNPPPVSELVPDVPAALGQVLARALAKSSSDRQETTFVFAQDLVSVSQGKILSPEPPLAEKTQARDAVTPSAEMAATPAGNLGALNRTVVQAGSSPAAEGTEERRQDLILDSPSAPKARRLWYGMALAALLACLASFYYWGAIEEQFLFYQAKMAAENGELEPSENKLEALLDRNPEFGAASELLSQVSADLLRPGLPLELTARHHHRLGHCTGNLTLHEWGIEYASKQHGIWQWRFHQLREMERDHGGSLSLETNEQEMLGLVQSKRYNFDLLATPIDEGFWKRYNRLSSSSSPPETDNR